MVIVVEWFSENFLVLAQVFSAFVTALATIALWRVTRILAVETKTLAKMTAQPFVVSWLESSGASPVALNFTIRNTGNAAAFDIETILTPGLPEKPNIDGSPLDLTPQTVFNTSVLPPGQMQSIIGAMGPQVADTIFSVRVSWAAYPKSQKREAIEYSFQTADGFRGGFETKGLHQIAEELKKIRERFSRL